jgi:hypothetical protein
MSTSTENQMTADSQSHTPVGASFRLTSSTSQPPYDVECRVDVFEALGRVSISWNLPAPYILSGRAEDNNPGVLINLLANGTGVAQTRFVTRQGTWATNEIWGSGWAAELMGWDWSSNSWLVQLATPATQESSKPGPGA